VYIAPLARGVIRGRRGRRYTRSLYRGIVLNQGM
jgi:hypothetical protein